MANAISFFHGFIRILQYVLYADCMLWFYVWSRWKGRKRTFVDQMAEKVVASDILKCRCLCHAASCYQNQEENQTNLFADLLHWCLLVLDASVEIGRWIWARLKNGMFRQLCVGFIYMSIDEARERERQMYFFARKCRPIHFFAHRRQERHILFLE